MGSKPPTRSWKAYQGVSSLKGLYNRNILVLFGDLYAFITQNGGLSKFTNCQTLTACHFGKGQHGSLKIVPCKQLKRCIIFTWALNETLNKVRTKIQYLCYDKKKSSAHFDSNLILNVKDNTVKLWVAYLLVQNNILPNFGKRFILIVRYLYKVVI